MIAVGSAAPDFQLLTQDGEPFRLSDWRGRANVLLLFLPAAFTPICTTELPALDAYLQRFAKQANTVPVAITVDNTAANREWARSCGANHVFVLSDFKGSTHGAVSRAYGAWLPADGVSDRATVIVDKNGVVRFAQSAGKFGKRSIPGLLQTAIQINGGRVAPAAQTKLPRLDLPVLYVSTTCSHCHNVLAFLKQMGLESHVVVRQVNRDPSAMEELLTLEPSGVVPVLLLNNRLYVGDDPAIRALRAAFRL